VMCTLFAPTAMQGNIHGRNKTRLVCPAFDQLAVGKRLVQPHSRVMTKARMQHQIGTTRDNVDGVDLQKPHPLDHGHDIGTPRTPPQRLQQALRMQMQQTRLCERYRRALGVRSIQRHRSFTDSRTG